MKKDLTNGSKKILLQFGDFIKTDYFETEIKRVRRILELPEDGLTPTADDIKKLTDDHWLPEKLRQNSTQGGLVYRKIYSKYVHETSALLEHLPVASEYLSTLVRGFIFFNQFYFQDPEGSNHSPDVCEISSAQFELDELSLDDNPDSQTSIDAHTRLLEEKFFKYPIVVRIHADAAQRDVVEYIRNNWSLIESLQKEFANPGKKTSIRNSKTQRKNKVRDDFIYSQKHLAYRQIVSLLLKQGYDLDEGSVGKIISIETKRRKKV